MDFVEAKAIVEKTLSMPLPIVHEYMYGILPASLLLLFKRLRSRQPNASRDFLHILLQHPLVQQFVVALQQFLKLILCRSGGKFFCKV